MFPGTSDLGYWRLDSAILFRRSSSSVDGLGFLGNGASGKDSVASLAHDIIGVEKVLHGERRTLPSADARDVYVSGTGTAISARPVKANAFVLVLRHLNNSFDFIATFFHSFVYQQVCFHQAPWFPGANVRT